MDDFVIYGDSFDECLHNLELVLKRCTEKNLTLNWEKCHIMVQHEIVLGHDIFKKRIEVDKVKIDVIAKLPIPKYVKDIRSFSGHAGFYRRFIKDFRKIARSLTNLIVKDVSFILNDGCLTAWEKLKMKLISAPIISPPDWPKLFEIICDAFNFAIGTVLGQRNDNKQHVIYYSSWTLNNAQLNYTTTKKEFLAVVFALEKFRPYLLGTKATIFTDHSALRYLMHKKDAKAWPIRWILLLEEFDLKIWDKKGVKNVIVDHLSRIPNALSNELPINNDFPDEQLLATFREPWFADIVNYLVTNQNSSHWLK